LIRIKNRRDLPEILVNASSDASPLEREAAAQDVLVAGLRDPSAYPHPVDQVEHIETHISHVFLAGDYAYKLKKPLDLGFLDFSTLAKRRFYCEEELRLNRRLAPRIYLSVVAVTGDLERPRVDGEGAVREYAVKMRRFPQECLLTRLPVTRSLADRIAEAVAAFHAGAAAVEPDTDYGTPRVVLHFMAENFAQIRQRLADAQVLSRLERLESWTRERWQALTPVIERRRREGRVRECHGDMHRGNIALVDDEPIFFDGIEFNAELRWIDTMSELAFLVMDLEEAGAADRGRRLLNRYLELSGDYAGLLVLDFYKVYRAMVRAKVAAIRLGQEDVEPDEAQRDREDFERYLALAEGYTEQRPQRLLITHGVSGTGKSRLGILLRERLPLIHIRSDIERKRMSGLPPLARTGSDMQSGLYAPAVSEQTYARLLALADVILDAGYSPLVDATFLAAARRRPFLDLAQAKGCPCRILELTASRELLEARVARREAAGRDPSEADLAVLQEQLAAVEPLTAAERALAIRIDTARPPKLDQLLAAIERDKGL